MTALPRLNLHTAVVWLLALSLVAGCGAAAGSAATSGSPTTISDTTTIIATTTTSHTTTISDTTPPATAPPTGSSLSVPTTTPVDCSDTSVASYDFVGTMHTVVPNGQPVTAAITPHGDAWCTGGIGEADVTLTNNGQGTEHVQKPVLVLHGGAAKWPLQEWPPLDLAAGESHTFAASFTVPGVNPGSYGLIVYGYDGDADVTVDGPTACATSDLTAIGTPPGGGAMGNLRTDITITNVGNHPCLLPEPNVIQGLHPPDPPTQLAFSNRTYFGDPAPLASHVLPVGGEALLYLGTGWPCLDETHPSVIWSGVRLSFLSDLVDPTVVDVAIEIDTACGLSVSSLGHP